MIFGFKTPVNHKEYTSIIFFAFELVFGEDVQWDFIDFYFDILWDGLLGFLFEGFGLVGFGFVLLGC